VLIRCQVRERATTIGVDGSQFLSPLAVTFHTYRVLSVHTGNPTGRIAPHVNQPAGVLEAYVCRSCGFVDWYAQSPAQIPIGPAFGTELIEVEGQGPYR
jgi:hypothetical protein